MANMLESTIECQTCARRSRKKDFLTAQHPEAPYFKIDAGAAHDKQKNDALSDNNPAAHHFVSHQRSVPPGRAQGMLGLGHHIPIPNILIIWTQPRKGSSRKIIQPFLYAAATFRSKKHSAHIRLNRLVPGLERQKTGQPGPTCFSRFGTKVSGKDQNCILVSSL